MWESPLLQWQHTLLERVERALGRKLDDADTRCVAWNPAEESLAVVTQPLLGELRTLNLMSNVFRVANRRPDPAYGTDSGSKTTSRTREE